MGVMRPFVLALISLLVAAAPTAAQTMTSGSVRGEAAEALATDPVVVHPDADPTLENPARIRSLIEEPDVGPAYVAVLPDAARSEAGGSTEALVYALRDELRREGTYVVFSGRQVRARSTILDVQGNLDEAIDEGGGSVDGIAVAFLESVREERAGGGSSDGGGGGGGGNGGLV